MTKTQIAIEAIRVEVAKHGEITGHATRLYIEHRISRERFDQAVSLGMVQYRNIQAGLRFDGQPLNPQSALS